jgi:DNA excision repair protein ERCC-4
VDGGAGVIIGRKNQIIENIVLRSILEMGYLPHKKKSNLHLDEVVILYDDREKRPWRKILYNEGCTMKRARLKVGDYTIKGFEDKVAIEKKNGLKELVNNISGKDRKRFKAFLTKLSLYEVKCIIIEDSLSNINKCLAELPSRCRINKKSILYWLSEITIMYGIPLLFIGKNKTNKKQLLDQLFKRVINNL